MIVKLTEVWKTCETKQLAKIFKEYMEGIGAEKWDSRRKDNLNTFFIDGKSTGWNRATCYFYKESANYANHNLEIVLRKRAGNYLIVGRKGERAFEVDYSGIRHYDETLLNEIMEEHKPLFDKLISITD